MKVSEVMAAHVEFIDAEATAEDAAALMGELDVSALPVGTSEDLKGILTDRDILYRLVAEGRDPRRTKVIQIATRLVFSCQPDDDVSVAMDVMAAQNVRRLPVIDNAKRVVGWLTLSDLSRRLLVDSRVVQQALHDLTDRIGPQAPPQAVTQPT